jgi:hypothetical protein
MKGRIRLRAPIAEEIFFTFHMINMIGPRKVFVNIRPSD